MAAALWLILAVLLFGSGAVLGLFSWIFWIIVAVAGLVLVIWFVASLPRMGKSIVEEDIEATKKAYRNHPTLTAVFWALLALFFVWLITALQQPSETAG